MAKKPEKKDPETTGHVWDGIEEFNNPLPRWWLWTLYLTIIWAIGYVIAYPAWPMITGATEGMLGYSSRAEVQKSIDAVAERNAPLEARIIELDLGDIITDEQVGGTDGFAYNGGKAVFLTFCSQCHGAGGAGNVGYPNLLDNDWLWGGDIDSIHQTISHGVRSEDDFDTRMGDMLAFGDDDMLVDDEIDNVVQYVRSLSFDDANVDMAALGETVFLDNCAACHMDDATGDTFAGAPNLTDAIWLYGSDVDTITATVTHGRASVMPAWAGRLSEAQIRSVAVFVHEQGGGQ